MSQRKTYVETFIFIVTLGTFASTEIDFCQTTQNTFCIRLYMYIITEGKMLPGYVGVAAKIILNGCRR
jgi:hypothetical protein